MATWNKLNVDSTLLTNNSTGTANKSLYIGNYGGVNWSVVQTALYEVSSDVWGPFQPHYINLRNLLSSATAAGYAAGDIDNNGVIDATDRTILYNYINGTATSTQINWIDTYIKTPILTNISIYAAEGDAVDAPIAAIYSGSNNNILGDPVNNASKIFFSTNFDYFRIKKIVDFTITLPARNRRSTGGGKKGGSGFLSYNGYADHYIYQHNYGDPPPAYTVFITGDASNGAIANHGITGSIPLQYGSADSFRLGLTYSSDKYLVLRERYQVYGVDIPALTLKVRAHFFENPTNVQSNNNLTMVHSPVTFDVVSTEPWWYGHVSYGGRHCYTTITFNALLGDTFDKVEVDRTAGTTTVPMRHYIDQINGVAVTPFDPITARVAFNYSPGQTVWSMRVVTVWYSYTAHTATPGWRVLFTNTATGSNYSDYVSGIHRCDYYSP